MLLSMMRRRPSVVVVPVLLAAGMSPMRHAVGLAVPGKPGALRVLVVVALLLLLLLFLLPRLLVALVQRLPSLWRRRRWELRRARP